MLPRRGAARVGHFGSELARLAYIQDPDPIVIDCLGTSRVAQTPGRLVQGLVGQVEGAEVHAEQPARAQIETGGQRLLGIHV